MKRMKKIIALVLSMIMVVAMSVTAFADTTDPGTTNETGKITVNNAVSGQKYSIYKLLDLESYSQPQPENEDDPLPAGQYSYKVNSAWSGFFAAGTSDTPAGTGFSYVEINSQGYVSWKEDADAAEFAKAALAYAKEKNIQPTSGPTEATSTKVEFDNLELGYYLMESTLGALCSLDTTNPNVTIEEKNEQPTIEKKVQEDSLEENADKGNGWQNANDADINQVVNFKTVVKAKKGAKNYVVHDKMSDGLTLDAASIAVAGATKNTDYTVETNVEHYEKDASGNTTSEVEYVCDFEITFTQAYLDRITKDLDEATVEAPITITYSATLNENAVIAGEGNPNDTKLTYGNDNETNWDQTRTYTWKVDVFKFTKNASDAEVALAGAEFKLSTDEAGNEVVKFSQAVDERNQNIANTYKVNSKGTIESFTTTETGELIFQGLDAGTYYLTEINAPKGYNKLVGPIKVVIGSTSQTSTDTTLTHTVKYQNSTGDESNPYSTETDVSNAQSHQIKVENKSGTELPETGGIGTTIFYVVGAILMIGAGVMLVTRKRISR